MRRIASTLILVVLTATLFVLAINIRPVEAYVTITIKADGTVDPSWAPIQRDGHKYTLTDNIYGKIVVNRSGIIIDGAGYTVQGEGPYTDFGFDTNFMSNLTIRNTNIKDVGVGFFLNSTSNSFIHENNITNVGMGFWLGWASNNVISENYYMASSGGWGFDVRSSWNNIFRRNNIANSSIAMIFFDGCWNNTVCENTVENIWFISLEITNSSSNKIFHNNFLDNTQIRIEGNSVNVWDNGCEGNYWSNYNGTDFDGDGIGDEYLPWEGVDNYPLMNLYWNPADTNHDLKVDIFDIVLCAGAYGSKPPDSKWCCRVDIAEPYGIIDIYDIVMICTSYGEEYNP